MKLGIVIYSNDYETVWNAFGSGSYIAMMREYWPMLEILLSNTIYVKVSKNQFWARHIENQKEAIETAQEPFTTSRLLVGEFTTAENCLRAVIKKVYKRKWLIPSPVIIIQPMEMVSGGLSQIEERVLMELAAGAGARKAMVWVGHELSDREVIDNANNV